MGTYEDLKAAIQQVIRTNGNNEITGALLQQTLLSIVNSVGANAAFAGIATPNTNPGTADQNVFYLATEAGTYVNFGGIEINMGEAVILSNKTGNWVKTTSGFATQQQLTELGLDTNTKFDELKSDIGALQKEDTNINALSNPREIVLNAAGMGYFSKSGNLNNSSSSWYSDFIPVSTDKLYQVFVRKSKYDTNVVFFESQDFATIVGVAIDDSQERNVKDIISVPQGANYMVVTTRYQPLFNVIEFGKIRTASATIENTVSLIKQQLENGVLNNLLSLSVNIFNPFENNIANTQFYMRTDGVLVLNNDAPFCFFVKIAKTKIGKYYNFNYFSDEPLIGAIRLGSIDALQEGNIFDIGQAASKRGYYYAESESDLYLYVQFRIAIGEIGDRISALNRIINSLVVTETQSQKYSETYIPYKKLDFSLQVESVSETSVNLFIVDNNGNVIGNKVLIEIGEKKDDSDIIDSAYVNSVKSIKYKLDSNVITEAISMGVGWSGNLTNGYTHESGNTEPLEFDLSQFSVGQRFILRFNSAGITSESADVRISVGDDASVKTYNGTSSFTLGFVANGGNLVITPNSGFASSLTNLSICAISDSGSEVLDIITDNVFAQQNAMITAFWNVALGAKDNTLNNLINGSRNIAIGNYALKTIVSGNRNVGIGTFAMPFLAEAENNVAIGADTIYPLKKAKNCVGIGKATLGGSQSAEDCVAIGAGAMGVYALNKDRFKCVAIGVSSGNSIVDSCTHVGYRAGANVAGARNTSIGYNSLAVGNRQTVDITGTDLTCVGSMAQIANTDEAKAAINSTAIGANTTITKSNQIVIGNSQVEEIVLGGKRIIFNADGTCRWENAL